MAGGAAWSSERVGGFAGGGGGTGRGGRPPIGTRAAAMSGRGAPAPRGPGRAGRLSAHTRKGRSPRHTHPHLVAMQLKFVPQYSPHPHPPPHLVAMQLKFVPSQPPKTPTPPHLVAMQLKFVPRA